MLDLNDFGKKITIARIAGLLDCSSRTIYRSMNKELTHEKTLLNEEV
jgi:transcriptional antiterminator